MSKPYFRRSMASVLSLTFALLTGGAARAQAPANDNCSGAIQLTINATCTPDTGNILNAGWQSTYPDPSCLNNIGSFDPVDIWFQFTPAAGQTSVNIAFGNLGDPNLDLLAQIFTSNNGTCLGNFSEIGCSDDAVGNLPQFNNLAVVQDTTYFIRVATLYPVTDVNQSGNFTICIQGSTVLPVGMSKLEGSLLPGGRASLTWQTYSEQNNAGFEVQHSADGRTFHKVGWVGTQARDGNSSQALSYRFTDKDAIGAVAYYRLQQVDKDGKTAWSDVVRLGEQVKGSFGITVAPNPVSNNMVITTQGTQGDHARLTLTDITGKPVLQLPVTGVQTAVDMSSLSQGLYLLRYTDDNRKETLKISKQ